MENEVPILSPQPVKKKRIAARVITAVLLSLAYFYLCLVAWEAWEGMMYDSSLRQVLLGFCSEPSFMIFLVVVTLVGTVIQVLITRKTDAKYLEMLLPNAVCLVGSLILLIVSKGVGIEMLITAFALLALRLLLSVIDCLVRKKAKWIPLFLALSVVTCCVGIGSCCLTVQLRTNAVGTPDRTGSWGSINQEIKRSRDWRQIVQNSAFQLGAIKPRTDAYAAEDDYIQSTGTYPVLDGSTVCVPMALEFARQHLGMSDETVASFVAFSTTHYAYLSLIQKEADFAYWDGEQFIELKPSGEGVDLILATEPSEEELSIAAEHGVTLIKKPVCCDAFVFITHRDNPVNSLTVKQIRDIYTGKITNWREVGGKDEKISAYQHEENSGSQTAMENLVMGGSNMIDPIKVPVIEGMGGLVNAVAEYENKTASIGYTYRYYIDTLYKNNKIKTIAVEGVEPTDENIRSGRYPFSTHYYGVIRAGDEEKTGGKFLDWILSDEGQECVRQAGYITVS